MRNKKNIYIYPMWDKSELKKHPYINSLCISLRPYYHIVNLEKRSTAGVFEILPYTFKIDALYLNWIEDIGIRKYGALQALFFLLYCCFFKIAGKKIIWTHHNKSSHAADNTINKLLTRFLCRHANFIVAHSKESKDILKINKRSNKLLYFFHPIETPYICQDNNIIVPAYDLLIWGNMRKSKGVQDFLNFLKRTNRLHSFKIHIIGRFENEILFNEMTTNYKSETINIENRFVGTEELQRLHAQAKLVLFPYTGKSVLNSGALVRSLVLGTPIIGPPAGAFKDLHAEGLIDVYSSFEDIISKISNTSMKAPIDKIESFCRKHTWADFAQLISATL